MRILQILATSTGGVGTHVRALARELSAAHEVAVLAPPPTLAHFDFAAAGPIATFPVDMSTRLHPRDAQAVRAMRARLREFGPDVVHAHGFRAGFLTLLARSPAVPVVVSWHNQASGRGLKGWVEGRVEAFVARRADLTLGASEDLVDRARQVGGARVSFAPVAAPAPAPVADAERRAARRELLGPGGGVLCLMVGRVAPQKNYELLLEVAERLRGHRLTFAIAGAADAELLAALRRRLAGMDLGGVRVEFLGPRTDVPALMTAADVYVLTSHWEARALVVQEALVAGLPIVASAVGGIPGLVGEAGILIDPARAGAADDFARAIADLTDPAAREAWAHRARERGRTLPGEAEVAKIITAHYAALARG